MTTRKWLKRSVTWGMLSSMGENTSESWFIPLLEDVVAVGCIIEETGGVWDAGTRVGPKFKFPPKSAKEIPCKGAGFWPESKFCVFCLSAILENGHVRRMRWDRGLIAQPTTTRHEQGRTLDVHWVMSWFVRVHTLTKIQGVFLSPYKSLYFDIKLKSLGFSLCACIKQPILACENSRFSSLFAAGDVSRKTSCFRRLALDVQKNGAKLPFEGAHFICVASVTKVTEVTGYRITSGVSHYQVM